jgi:hypothetical protein
MHPLERQVNDLKEQLALKARDLEKMSGLVDEIKEGLEEIKDMLHPSRQKHAEALTRRIDETVLKRH